MSLPLIFQQVGVAAFGWSLPTLAPQWSTALPTADEQNLALTLAGGTWSAPLAGTLRVIGSGDIGETLIGAAGAVPQGPGLLLSVLPAAYLRLCRLYASLLEDATGARPERALGLPFRPVPKYFLYRAAVPGAAISGHVAPGDTLDIAGELTIYGADGLVIDPLAVASAFTIFMHLHELLQHRPFGDAFVPNHQVRQIAGLAATEATHVRLSLADGTAYAGANLVGLTALAGDGLFTLDGAEVSKAAAGAGFPEAERRLLKFGHATTGRLTDGPTTFPTRPAAVTFAEGFRRDFYSLRVLPLGDHVIGTRPAVEWADLEARPEVRVHEPATLLVDGNEVLAAAAAALVDASETAIVVAQRIAGDFAAPTEVGDPAHWPAFPPLPVGATPAAGSIDPAIRAGFLPGAHFISDGDPGTPDLDVSLTLHGLPAHAAVRAYNRRFVEDAREARGDGAGGVVAADGTLTLRLRDPLGLAAPSPVIPSDATLRVDLSVVQRDGNARIFGNVACPISAAAPAPAPAPASNGFTTPTRRATCEAAILGHSGHAIVAAVEPYLAAYQLAAAGPPREAPRLPTMARRELIVAGLAAGSEHPWRAVIAGGKLLPETHGAAPRLGAPGGLGGRETQVVGVSTQRGLLAHDLARAALRRAVPLVARLDDLKDSEWDEPAAPAELPVGDPATEARGTFAGAVLQTLAPHSDSPELYPLHDDLPAEFAADLAALATFVQDNLPDDLTEQTALKTKLNALSADAGITTERKARLHAEVKRELSTSLHGRRDAQWALQSAISRARRFIYIETPAFGPTRKTYPGTPPLFTAELTATLGARMSAAPGLRVLLCTPKYGEGPPGYEAFAAREVEQRRAAVVGLPTAALADPEASRVVAFHPVGFPGRASRLESTVVIIDDLWLLVGASQLRRRGLTFDGASDLVLVDTDLVQGASPAISGFRRRLLASRIGAAPGPLLAGVPQPDPTYTRLADGVEAFHAVRELLIAGGLGKVERLWNGHTEGVTYVDPDGVSRDVADPEGKEYDLAGTLLLGLVPGFRF